MKNAASPDKHNNRGEAALTRTAKSLKAEGDKIKEEVGDIGARI